MATRPSGALRPLRSRTSPDCRGERHGAARRGQKPTPGQTSWSGIAGIIRRQPLGTIGRILMLKGLALVSTSLLALTLAQAASAQDAAEQDAPMASAQDA